MSLRCKRSLADCYGDARGTSIDVTPPTGSYGAGSGSQYGVSEPEGSCGEARFGEGLIDKMPGFRECTNNFTATLIRTPNPILESRFHFCDPIFVTYPSHNLSID